MERKRPMRAVSLMLVLCLILGTGALAAVLGELIDGHDTYLGAGMELSKGVYWTGSDYQTENYIEYSPDSAVRPVVVSGSKLTNYGNFTSMATLLEREGKHVIAGINGDYYVMANYEPLGIVVQEGELWSSDAGHWGIGFNKDGGVVFGKPALEIRARMGGQDFSLTAVNKTRNTGEAVLYTDRYAAATKNKGEGLDLVCSLSGPPAINSMLTLKLEETLDKGGAVTIPAGKAVLSLSADVPEALKIAAEALTPGQEIQITISAAAQWEKVDYAIGSLYKLVTDGIMEKDLPSGAAPRSAVGKKADGSLVFYTIDGRQKAHSAGVSVSTLAQRMLELGCVEAAIMDGGGSTSLNAIYIGDSSVSQINKPSEGVQRSVSNYIMLITEAKPTGTATRLALYPLSTNILSGATTSFTLKAADENGYPAKAGDKVSLAVTEGLGSIASDGSFTAGKEGKGNVTASAEGLVPAAVQINVVQTPDSITVANESGGAAVSTLTVSTGSVTRLTAAAMINHLNLISQDTCFAWTVSGGIGSIDASGSFTAGDKDATGSISVRAGEKTVSIPVTVVNPEKFDDVKKGDWFYEAVTGVSDKGIMNGVGNRSFAPNANASRGMVVTVLHRLAGSPEPTVTLKFTDVPADSWYAKAIAWAAEKGIAEGYGGKFDPEAPVTREQLAALLYRNADSPETADGLSGFVDAAKVSAWAAKPMSWAVEKKLMNGLPGELLAPGEKATRAQIASILYRMGA